MTTLSDLNLNPYEPLEEIDIQQEVVSFLLGEDFGTQKTIPFIHRELRRDKFDEPEKCICYDSIANEGVSGCPYCDGVGFYWDESIIPGILFLLNKRKIVSALDIEIAAGRRGDYEVAFITPYDINIKQRDYLNMPHLTDAGFIKYPLQISESYYVVEAIIRRLDLAKKEYSLSIITLVI